MRRDELTGWPTELVRDSQVVGPAQEAADELRALAHALAEGEPFTDEMHARLRTIGVTLDARYYRNPEEDFDPLAGVETEGAMTEDHDNGGLLLRARRPHQLFCTEGETIVNVTAQDGVGRYGRRTALFAATSLNEAAAWALEELADLSFPDHDEPNVFLIESPAPLRSRRPALEPLENTQTVLSGEPSDGCTLELASLSEEILVHVEEHGRAHATEARFEPCGGSPSSALYELVPEEPAYGRPTL
jgi:hypothetical protein